MHAILISEENRPKIEECLNSDEDRREWYTLAVYTSEKDYYYIRGYYFTDSATVRNTVLPGYIIRESYEYDADKIKTDWDQIVRI